MITDMETALADVKEHALRNLESAGLTLLDFVDKLHADGVTVNTVIDGNVTLDCPDASPVQDRIDELTAAVNDLREAWAAYDSTEVIRDKILADVPERVAPYLQACDRIDFLPRSLTLWDTTREQNIWHYDLSDEALIDYREFLETVTEGLILP